MFSSQFDIDPNKIVVGAERQRKKVDTKDLKESIAKRGIMHPIIIDNANTLVSGERRLTCAKELGLKLVPVRYADTLDRDELEIIELEENTKRENLTWQENILAVARIHEIFLARDPKWTLKQTGEELNIFEERISWSIALAEEIKAGNPEIMNAQALSQARTIYERKKQRKTDAALNALLGAGKPVVAKPAIEMPKGTVSATSIVTGVSQQTPKQSSIEVVAVKPLPKQNYEIICTDSIKFMNEYEGEKFNLLHCDFPYGVPLNGQAKQENFGGGGYESNEDIYWELCAALCKNMKRLTGVSTHIMFWFSMKFYTETIEFFAKNAPQVNINPVPLIWHKTDNRGILPDAKRGPRQIYEPCFLMSTGDRHIVKPVGNVYGAPTGKADAIHTNEKPEPMLGHFMSMFVDELSVVLDPTCGSGSAIRVAERLGAKSALGLEINPEFAKRSQERLLLQRRLGAASGVING